MTENTPQEIAHAPKKKLNKGGRNLILLGIASTIIALITTGASLLIYHNSGDIYLDRSRPGFMPDEEEAEEDAEDEEYNFSKTGPIDLTVLEEYLEKIKGVVWFTLSSVHCAERIVATKSSKGVLKFKLHFASG